MNARGVGIAAALTIAVGSTGCAGDGTGLDEFGNPLGAPRSALAPTMTSIQQNIFTPICRQCHTGGAAPAGLALDPAVAWGNLVDVPSAELPTLRRVRPGVGDSSYLVWKIEGRAGIVGARMPLGLLPLSSTEIVAIRGWIADGARNN